MDGRDTHPPASRSRLRDRLTAGVFVCTLFGLCLANAVHTPPEISQAERRALAQKPALVTASGFNWDFSAQFEAWATDGFIGRDGFRRIQALSATRIFGRLDNHGLYLVSGSVAETGSLDARQAALAARKIAAAAAALPESVTAYYAVVPDKGHYLSGGRYPAVDQAALADILAQNLPGLTGIDLRPALAADSYYATDLHWRQEALEPVVTALGAAMGFEAKTSGWQRRTLAPFFGVYAGQAALPLEADSLTYLTAGWMDGASARYLDPSTLALEPGPVYWPERFDGVDPYDLFLGGAQPLVTLENPEAPSGRTLYLFRDSFGSSLAPLLAGYYAHIVLIDLRYLALPAVSALVDFEPDADALFLYSSAILADSSLLLVPISD